MARFKKKYIYISRKQERELLTTGKLCFRIKHFAICFIVPEPNQTYVFEN
jgi:hypothetical protein